MKIIPLYDSSGNAEHWMFWCPGCEANHAFIVGRWTFNGDMNKPTFSPSLLYGKDGRHQRCHIFVTDGKIQYLSDCDHELAGQIINLPEYPD